MRVCPNCGEENPERFPLCGFCGTQLAPELPPQEVRKTVTIVFSDLKGSTNLGEALDSESLREVMSRYFDEMRAVLEHHGGMVEKYIGDAIMAVFGLPRLHEDDALRAVRAAASMQDTLATLNVELKERWGVALTNRTGVNTGEIVAGDPSLGQRLVTGDAVNVAARLEQAAPANEILIGDSTYRLVRDGVHVEDVEPLELKGKSERVPAYRLLSASSDGARAQTSAGALIGREAELATLEREFARAVTERSCRSVTLVADAGVGKSRLVEEFARRVDRSAAVLRGRCLSYGRGITFWPIVEIVRQASGIREDDPPERARQQIAAILGEAADAADQVAATVGLSEREFPLDELFWGVRKLLETLARRGPLVVLFEDVHWGELTLLDLIEHVAVSSSDAPMLILCTARPEFDEGWPGWGPAADSARIDLGALSAEETALVVRDLLGGSEVREQVIERVVEASEGNPLFVEQMIAMLVDDEVLRREDGRWEVVGDLAEVAVPPSINALLAARLDLLSAEERAVVEPASVIGGVFVTAAVEALVPEGIGGEVARHLQALVRKRFITPNPAADSDSAFRFHHILVREAAYQGLLKRRRATLHERYADWADEVNRDRERAVEYEEIQGYHLEQAHGYLSELGPLDDHGRELGLRAGIRLSSAGRRAFGRGDMPAAANLLRRAAGLFPEADPRRLELLPSLGEAMMEIGEFAWGELFLNEAVERTEGGETRLLADAVLTRLVYRSFIVEDLEGWSAEVVSELDRLIPALERVEAHAELAKAWRLLGFVHGSVCRWSEQVDAVRKAIEQARLAGNARLEARLTAEYANGLREGPTPVDEAIVQCQAALDRGLVDRQAEALVRCSLARLRAMQGDFAEARELIAEAGRLREELGANVIIPVTSLHSSRVETLAGHPEVAEGDLRVDFEKLSSIGHKYVLPVVGVLLARAVCQQGRYEEATELTATVEQLADETDVETQAIRRCVSAQLLVAEEGNREEAERLAREAAALVHNIESPDLQGDCLVVLAEVLAAAGRRDEACHVLREACDLYRLKGNVISAERTHALEGELLPSAANA
ncbi:MAG: guanylate cyclase [Actinobacteria bacterium]|nr:MAG: guanylate cyclase [Actinomycetota bacterium]